MARLPIVLLVVALSLGACGGGDDTTDTAASTATPAASESPSPTGGTTDSADDTDGTDGTGTTEPTEPTVADGATPTPTTTVGPTPTFEASGEVAFDADSSLTTVGLDDVYFGMTIDEASRAADAEFTLPEERPDCYSITPTAGPDGVFFTVLDERIERVDITNAAIRTRSGAGVGTTETELTELFGDRLVTSRAGNGNRIEYVPEDADDATHRLIFITDGTAVVSLRGGRQSVVEPDIPCGA